MKHLPIAGLLLLSLTACNRSAEAPSPAATAPSAGAAATPAPMVPATGQGPARLDGFAGAMLGAGITEVRSGFGAPP